MRTVILFCTLDSADTLSAFWVSRPHSPSLYSVGPFLQFYHYIDAIFPRTWQRAVAKYIPHAGFQRLCEISDTVSESSIKILEEKKDAIERGGEALKQQLVEGKDIMSILRTCSPITAELSFNVDLVRSACKHGCGRYG